MLKLKTVFGSALIWGLILLTVGGMAGCKGGGGSSDPEPTAIAVNVAQPDENVRSEDADWQVSWTGGLGPYNVVTAMGGGAEEVSRDTSGLRQPSAAINGNHVLIRFHMVGDPGDPYSTVVFTFTIIVTDSHGVTGVAEGIYVITPGRDAPRNLQIVPPAAAMAGGQAATWHATWERGHQPCSVHWTMDGGAADVPVDTPASGEQDDTRTFTMINNGDTPNNYDVGLRLTDAMGYSIYASLHYTVGPYDGPDNTPPEISATYDAATWTIAATVDDAEDGPQGLKVWLSEMDHFFLDTWAMDEDQGGYCRHSDANGKASFYVMPYDLFQHSSEPVVVHVIDSSGMSASVGVDVSTPAVSLEPDALYAIPLRTQVAVDQPVVIQIATGVPANPFQYMNCVGLVVGVDADFVRNTFDAGISDITQDGSSAVPVDGIWAEMNPSGLILPPDALIRCTEIGGGLERWDFNVSPLGGKDLTDDSGGLFNVKFRFATPGTYTLGFQQFQEVSRTYYWGNSSIDEYWGDITNDHYGVWNTVTVH